MALTKCKECGAQVSTKADKCPQCGASVAKKYGCVVTALWMAVIVMGLLIVMAWLESRGVSTQTETATEMQAEPVTTPEERAGKTYTPAQLRQMVSSGKYPAQGNPSTKTQSMAFSTCVATVKSTVEAAQPNYPAQTIVNTSLMYLVKLYTNDAAMTMTCSSPDRKLVITTAEYL